MVEHIPNVTAADVGLFTKKYYADSEIIRIPLFRNNEVVKLLPSDAKLWVDAGFDGCDNIESRRLNPKCKTWCAFMGNVPHFSNLENSSFVEKPSEEQITMIVDHLLHECSKLNPEYITVPQLPVIDGAKRNKINRALAKAAGEWKKSNNFSGKLILPLVFTNQRQLNKKTDRNLKVKQAKSCYNDASADGFWVVDQSLSEEKGSVTLRRKRFLGLIAMHQELNAQIPSNIKMGGPYWGLNLILWARGLIQFPLIGVASGYQYFLSGGPSHQPISRIAIPSLRRRVKVKPNLKNWFDKAINKIPETHYAYKEFIELRDNLTNYKDVSRSKEQTCKFYKEWYNKIAHVPASDRLTALFRDLSDAYLLGKSLPPFDDEESTIKGAAAVVDPLMNSCFSNE